MRAAGVALVHVPYNGPSAAIAAVASGDAQMMVVSITTGIGLSQAGRIRPLAILSTQRSPLLPDVPTAIEQGLPDFDVSAWIGLVAPAGTSADVVARVNRDVAAILASTDTRAWAQASGLEIAAGSADVFATTLASDYRRWGDVIRQIGLRGE